jgi:hypothetical protein
MPSHSAPKAADLRHSTAKPCRRKAQTSVRGTEPLLNSPPDAITPATFTLAGKEWPVARPISMPVADPARQQLAKPLHWPPQLLWIQYNRALHKRASMTRQSRRSGTPKGFLSVAAYDAMTGTLQTKDGKTFILGTSVAAGNATSWDEYRSGVHYRCDQTGSCILMRAGAVAPNARLI